MATVDDVEVANASFPNVRQDLNDILEAITTNFSADDEPTTTYPNQFWYETDTNLLYIRNEANDAWITLASIDQTSSEWEPRTAVIQAIDAAGLSFKTDEGTTRVEIADDGSVTINTSLDVDNIKIDGNTISSTDTNGDINITPDGTGKVVIDGLSYPTADGSDGQVLTTDGSGNIAFEDAGGAGKVLQVVQTITKTAYSSTSSSWTPMSDNCLITPTSASSKFVILFTGMMNLPGGADNFVNILRTVGGTTTPVEDYGASRGMFTAEGISGWIPVILTVRDSPATTSQINYRVGAKATTGDSIGSLNFGTNGGMFLSTVVMEIAG